MAQLSSKALAHKPAFAMRMRGASTGDVLEMGAKYGSLAAGNGGRIKIGMGVTRYVRKNPIRVVKTLEFLGIENGRPVWGKSEPLPKVAKTPLPKYQPEPAPVGLRPTAAPKVRELKPLSKATESKLRKKLEDVSFKFKLGAIDQTEALKRFRTLFTPAAATVVASELAKCKLGAVAL